MATNLNIDTAKLEEWVRVGEFKTKREAVNAAIEESLRRRAQMKIFDLAGTIDYDPAYDYKKARRGKRA